MDSQSERELPEGEGGGAETGTAVSTGIGSSSLECGGLTTNDIDNASMKPNYILTNDDVNSPDSRISELPLADSVWKFHKENGRTYHGYRAGTYHFPNDPSEVERLDFQHLFFDQLFNGRLHFAPLTNLRRVLDIGCGTGAWAIEMGDLYPTADIEGTDLSPIQPTAVPENVHFIIDDAEDSDWAVPLNHYDYIHTRQLFGCFRDFRTVIAQSLQHLKPGGWIESQEVDFIVHSDDNTIPDNWAFEEWLQYLGDAAIAANRPLRIGKKLKAWYIEAGFVDVQEKVFTIPLGVWPKDPKLKGLGRIWQENILMGLQGFSLAYFSREFGWSKTETEIYLANVRKSLLERHVHAYQKMYIVWGRKPEAHEQPLIRSLSMDTPSPIPPSSSTNPNHTQLPTFSTEVQHQDQLILPPDTKMRGGRPSIPSTPAPQYTSQYPGETKDPGKIIEVLNQTQLILDLEQFLSPVAIEKLLTALSDLGKLEDLETVSIEALLDLRQALKTKYPEIAFIIENLMEQEYKMLDKEQPLSDIPDTVSVTSDASAVFSTAFSLSSKSSIASLINDAIELFTTTIINEGGLQDIYQNAVSKYTEERFLRNHRRLLKRFFLDLATEVRTDTQRHAVRALRGSLQRTQVSSRVFAFLSKKNIAEREHMKALSMQEVDRKENLNSFFRSIQIDGRGREEITLRNKEQPHARSESSSSGSDNDDAAEETEDLSVAELRKIVDFFLRGNSFQRFKENFRRFVYPPSTIREALASEDIRVLEKVLRNNFRETTHDEYSWLREVEAIGYSVTDMAELLMEQAIDTPWIFFKPQPVPASEISHDFHLPNCAHQFGQNSARPLSPYKTLVQPEGLSFSSPNGITRTEKIIQVLLELCGLAGIAPFSRDLNTWNGRVRFEDDNSTSHVTYGFEGSGDIHRRNLISCIHRALDGFCLAVSHVQAASCCCDCFTVLRIIPRDVQPHAVEMIRIRFELAFQLQDELRGLLSSGGIDLLQNWKCCAAAGRILRALHVPYDTNDDDEYKEETRQTPKVDEIDEILHMCCLAVQFLCLGFLSYSQAHCGTIHPFFLDTPQTKVVLRGSKEDQEDSWRIETQLVDLTCIGEMVQGSVIVFSAINRSDHLPTSQQGLKFDILATPGDLVDTWGPGEFIGRVSETGSDLLYAIGLGGGIIKASTSGNRKFHWSRNIICDTDAMSSIELNTKLLVGATVTINNNCSVDEAQLWLNSEDCLENLGTFEGYWEAAERQAGIQAGQYVTFAFLQTWAKKKRTTLKEFQLSLPDNHLLPFLRSTWGLQVSCCTGIARRVSLCELIADVMPAFVESLFPIPRLWETLKQDHNIIQAFQSGDLQKWLGDLNDECQQLVAVIIRYILSILAYTGVDNKGENFRIAWVRKMRPFQCFKLSCQKKNYWARILTDSGDCATFAYITSKCLQTSSLGCRGLIGRWPNETTLLETAVCRHKPDDTVAPFSTVPWLLKHEAYYFMGTLESPLLVKVERENLDTHPRLYVTPSKIPAAIVSRLRLKRFSNIPQTQQRLRERQWVDAQAESVVVLAAYST